MKTNKILSITFLTGLTLLGCGRANSIEETTNYSSQAIETSTISESETISIEDTSIETTTTIEETTIEVETTIEETEDTSEAEEITEEVTSEEESTEEETTEVETTIESTTIVEEPTAPVETTPKAIETQPVETTPVPTTPVETTIVPTTVAPTTVAPTTIAPVETKPVETKPVETKPIETKPVVTMTGISASVNGNFYIGDTLTAANFNVVGNFSDGHTENLSGWAAAPLNLSAATNTITVTYQNYSTTVTVNAAEKPVVQPTQPAVSTVSYDGNDVLHYAFINLFRPYKLGGKDPSTGFDCSGYVQYCYKQVGIDIPASPAAQKDCGKRYHLWEAKIGDILVVEDRATGSVHTGIYAGNGIAYDSVDPIGTSFRIVSFRDADIPNTYRYYVVRPGNNTAKILTSYRWKNKKTGEVCYSNAISTYKQQANYRDFIYSEIFEKQSVIYDLEYDTITINGITNYKFDFYGGDNWPDIEHFEFPMTWSVVFNDIE